MHILKSFCQITKNKTLQTLIATQKHKSTQILGTPYVLVFYVQIRVELCSFHTLILNQKMFLAYKIITEQKKNNKVSSYALFLELHYYHTVDEAAWLMEHLDDRASAYVRKAVNPDAEDLRNYSHTSKRICP